MFHSFKTIVAAAALATVSFTADAATYSASTLAGGAGGIGLAVGDNGSIYLSNNSAYDQTVTTPDSQWVWAAPDSPTLSPILSFVYSFTLSAQEALAASLSGYWGVDNAGTVKLNGTTISSLLGEVTAHFSQLTVLASSGLFVEGLNTLTFDVQNLDFGGGSIADPSYDNPAAFRASVTVTTPAPVPLPASLPLLAGAVAAFGFVARRKRNA